MRISAASLVGLMIVGVSMAALWVAGSVGTVLGMFGAIGLVIGAAFLSLTMLALRWRSVAVRYVDTVTEPVSFYEDLASAFDDDREDPGTITDAAAV